MQKIAQTIVVLGTGGTIAGTSADASDNVGYTAGQVGAAQLVKAVPALAGASLETEQVSQLDSKDMSHDVWRQIALRCAHHLARDDVAGLVVTHGTDTMEETAWFLQRVLAPIKPIVITGAMRPSTSLQPDGPQNMLDAVTLVRSGAAQGVVVAFSSKVHGARDVRKVHPYQIDAFTSGDAGPVACVEEGRVRIFRPWPAGEALGVDRLPADGAAWPLVEIIASHAGATGAVARALCAAGVKGLVVACTGNGTLHCELEAALLEAAEQGIKVLRSTRTRDGRVLDTVNDKLPSAGDLTPEKARIELLLQLM